MPLILKVIDLVMPCSLTGRVWIIQVEVDNEKFELRLWDTAGQEAYEELRKQVGKIEDIWCRYIWTDDESISFLTKAKEVFFQAYIGAQVIIIGFCLVNRYEEIYYKQKIFVHVGIPLKMWRRCGKRTTPRRRKMRRLIIDSKEDVKDLE